MAALQRVRLLLERLRFSGCTDMHACIAYIVLEFQVIRLVQIVSARQGDVVQAPFVWRGSAIIHTTTGNQTESNHASTILITMKMC